MPVDQLAGAAAKSKTLIVHGDEPGREGPLQAQVTKVTVGGSVEYVVVAATIRDILDGGLVVRNSVGIGFPVLLLVLAGLSWLVVWRHPAPGRVAAPRRGRDQPAPAGPAGCRSRTHMTRCSGSPSR